MYNLLALLSGIVLATSISINGELTALYGGFHSGAVSQSVGFVCAIFMVLAAKDNFKGVFKAPIWAYLGGPIGVTTTVLMCFAYGRISTTSVLALSLLGQSIISVVIDNFGLLGFEKRPFKKVSIIGYIIALVGIVVMMDFSSAATVSGIVLSLAAGVFMVITRTFNARLGMFLGAAKGNMMGQLAGIPFVLLMIVVFGEVSPTQGIVGPAWIWLGGIGSAVCVLLYNVVMPKLPSFRVTILTNVGQIAMGFLIDVMFGGDYSIMSVIGGLLIVAGVLINMYLEKDKTQEA